MKIIVINGQNHKGSTWNIGNQLVSKITGKNEIKEYFLPKNLNHFCLGCFACLEKRERCPFWPEKEIIQNDMIQADLLVFTSPNYCMMPSASMKAFLDLFFTNWMAHKPLKEMFSKKAVVVSSTAGGGAKKTTKLIANNLTNWGIPNVTEYGIAVNAMDWETVPDKIKRKIDKATDKMAAKLSRRQNVKVGIKTRFLFRLFRGMQKADWGASKAEKKYWLDNGWLDEKKPWKQ